MAPVWMSLQEDLLRHMATGCRNRTVSCIVCKLRARLPDMLRHLRLHRTDIQLQLIRNKRKVAAAKAAGRGASGGVKEEGGAAWGDLHHHDRGDGDLAGRSRNAMQLVAAAAEPAEGAVIMAILPCGAGGGSSLAEAVADAVSHSRPVSTQDRDAQSLTLLAESSGRSSLSNAGLEPGVDSDRTAAHSSRPDESFPVSVAAVQRPRSSEPDMACPAGTVGLTMERRDEGTSLPMMHVAGSGRPASRYVALHRMLRMLTQQVRRRAAAAAVMSVSTALSPTAAAAADAQAGPPRSGVASESNGQCTEELSGAGDLTVAADVHEDLRVESEDAQAQWEETLGGTLLDALMGSRLDEDLMASVGEESDKSDAAEEEEAVVVGMGADDADDCSPCMDCSDVEMYRYLMQAISGCEVTTKG